MKREEKTIWNVFFIICVSSYLVTAIVTFEEDEKETIVPSTNETIFEKLEEEGTFKDNLTYDKLEESNENVDFNTKQKIDEEIGDQTIFADFTSQNSGILNDVFILTKTMFLLTRFVV
ncbi:hypothetical protein WA026_006460 [Henosepilachna vigintioctopunctata]|uniref:Uncharacterized protein n=1 Tax=Henosepilachna vigintioctopunctata TaxID=420089 RepID=A0AAW1UI39_9CUCU